MSGKTKFEIEFQKGHIFILKLLGMSISTGCADCALRVEFTAPTFRISAHTVASSETLKLRNKWSEDKKKESSPQRQEHLHLTYCLAPPIIHCLCGLW